MNHASGTIKLRLSIGTRHPLQGSSDFALGRLRQEQHGKGAQYGLVNHKDVAATAYCRIAANRSAPTAVRNAPRQFFATLLRIVQSYQQPFIPLPQARPTRCSRGPESSRRRRDVQRPVLQGLSTSSSSQFCSSSITDTTASRSSSPRGSVPIV